MSLTRGEKKSSADGRDLDSMVEESKTRGMKKKLTELASEKDRSNSRANKPPSAPQPITLLQQPSAQPAQAAPSSAPPTASTASTLLLEMSYDLPIEAVRA